MSALALGKGPTRAVSLAGEEDAWPHTRRLLPWLLACFLVMIFLIPFDSVKFRLHLPADATLDRLLVVVMGVIALFRAKANRSKRESPRMTSVEWAVLIFGAVTLLSVVLNIARIYQLNEFTLVEKSFAQLLSYIAFFFIVVATVRTSEMPAFARLILGLTCLTALGTLYEAHTGVNPFFELWAKLLSGIASVAPAVTNIHPTDGHAVVVGPTKHGLALASLFTMALPFAVLPLLEKRRFVERLPYLCVIGLILAADLSTDEKTAAIAPIAVFITLMVYKRQLLRWAPVAIIVLIPVIHFAAPGTLGGLQNDIPTASNSNYSDGRASDYAAIAPDILGNLAIGRGYGTLDVLNWRWYRILDNQYLDELFEVGVLGLVAYLGIIFFALATAHRVIKLGGTRAPPALAAAAGCAAYGVLSATFDAMAYPQAVYAFLFAAGVIAAGAREPVPSVSQSRLRLFDFSRYRSEALTARASADG